MRRISPITRPAFTHALLVCGFLLTFLMGNLRCEQPGGANGLGFPMGVEPGNLIAIEALPKVIDWDQPFDSVQLLITGTLESGQTVDVTRLATLVQELEFLEIDDRRRIRAKKNGQGELEFELSGSTVRIPVRVSGLNAEYRVSFVQDVMPALSKMGCNTGTCHGSKDGQNGFKLSLRGYDPLFDHQAITDELAARRVNRVVPEQSLILLKLSGSIPHVGGTMWSPGDAHYQLLRDWIRQGVRLDSTASRVQKIELLPRDPVVLQSGMTQQVVVLATYTDGTQRDVTSEAIFDSGNIEVAQTESRGLVHLLRRGEAAVLARYQGAYASSTITVMGDRHGFTWNETEPYNYIDQHIYNKLQRMKIAPSALCSDVEFTRRVYLDLTGLPPTSDQVRHFLSDGRDSRTKRETLVDQLVGNGSYIEHWTNKWGDMLQVNRKFLGREGAQALRDWIKHALASNVSYDRLVYDILVATGSNVENPAASYWKIWRDPARAMENTTHLFLATRFNCNKCHDHPFERWTQDQYYELASYFSRVGRKPDPNFAEQTIGGTSVEKEQALVEVVYDLPTGEIRHDRTGEDAKARFPYQHTDMGSDLAPRRQQLARWITSPENPYFAKSYVNRLWGYLFGRGIIEPIDDIRAGNPPTHPQLLAALTRDFLDSGFDIQHMLRVICKSRTYQHAVHTNRWNEDDQLNFSHAVARRLPAEVLFDAIHLASGSRAKIPGLPPGFRAAELPDVGFDIPFLDDFGRPERESSCECERSNGVVLGPIMKLINGPTVANALADPENELAKLVAEQEDDAVLIEEIYLRFLGRPPSEEEIDLGRWALQQAALEKKDLLLRLESAESTLGQRQAEWLKRVDLGPRWKQLEVEELHSDAGVTLIPLEDRSVLVSGPHGKQTYTLTARTDLSGMTGIRLEVLPDKSLPQGGPGRAPDGNFVISRFRVRATSMTDSKEEQTVVLTGAVADFNQSGRDVFGTIDEDLHSGWGIRPEVNQPHEARFEMKTNIGFKTGTLLTFEIDQQYYDGLHSIGRFRISVTTDARPIGFSSLPFVIVGILKTPVQQRSNRQLKELTDYYRSIDSEVQRIEAELKQVTKRTINSRLVGVQDLAWALINSPAFLFNH